MHTTLHTIVYLSINVAIGAGLLTMSTLAPTTAHAEEVSWNEQVAARAFRDNVFGDDTTNSGFWIREPHVTLRYRAFVRNATTGEIIPPNGTVAAGTPL